MIVDEKNKPGPLIHQLTEARGDKTFLFAYYRGRPDLNTLAPLVRDVVLGNTKPIASFDAKTNTITLSPTGKPES